MSGILICASIVNGALSNPTKEVLGMGRTIAEKMGGPVSAALLGNTEMSVLTRELILCGADRVYLYESEKLAEFHANIYLKAIEDIVEKVQPRIIIFPGEAAGAELAPRLAQRLDAGLVTDCIDYQIKDDAIVYSKPVYGGKAIAHMRITSPVSLITVRPGIQETCFEDQGRSGDTIRVEAALENIVPETNTVEQFEEETLECPLEEANVVVAGGRGLPDAESFEQLRALADLLNGAVGASRVAVDQALVPPSCQIGLTGKIVSPDVYFAIGISGASQHIAGISGSKYIVAINKDEDAPIFNISNVGVVEDYGDVLPALIEALKKGLHR